MRTFLLILFVFISAFCKAQLATDYDAPIRWLEQETFPNFLYIGIDTITFDTINITNTTYRRVSEAGALLELLEYKPDQRPRCGRDGINPTGIYRKYFANGRILETGRYWCSRKVGEWLYYYNNGQLRKREYYEEVNTLYGHLYIGLSGMFKEYHSNGRVKRSGNYRFFEEYTTFKEVNVTTYKVEEKCCDWMPVTMKEGVWIEFDDEGTVFKRENFDLEIEINEKRRDFIDVYSGKNINLLNE